MRLFWCAATLVLIAVVSYVITSCYTTSSEDLATTATTPAPRSAAQDVSAAAGTPITAELDSRVVVGKYTLSPHDVAAGISGPNTLDAFGVGELRPGQVILVKGGQDMFRTGTEEEVRQRRITRFTNPSSSTAVSNALARCYRVVDVTSTTCRAGEVTPLMFLRRPHEGGSVYTSSADTAAVFSACKDTAPTKCARSDCDNPAKYPQCARTCGQCAHNPSAFPPRTCAEPTPCPLQVSFGFAPSAIESYGEGTFAYVSGLPALTPLDEGKPDVRTWEKGRVRAFYGAVRNFGYDYKNSEFRFKGDDNPHWFFSWPCPWGGNNHDGTPWGGGNSQRCPAAWQGELEQRGTQSFKGNAKRVYNGDIDTDRGNCMVCNLAGQVPGPDAAFWVGSGKCTKGYTKTGGGHFGSSVCSPPINKMLGDATFHSRVWAADGGAQSIGTKGADYMCSEKVLGDNWSAAYHAGQNLGFGAYPSFVRGAARASIRNNELLGVCNMYREVTAHIATVRKTDQMVKPLGRAFANQTVAEDRVMNTNHNRDKGNWAINTIDYPESHLVVTDSDGQLLAKMPPNHAVDFNRAPFAGSEGNGPTELGPQLSWLPEKADGRASMEAPAKGESCSTRCHARKKFCVDLHELGANNLHSFVYGSETAITVAEKTKHVRCDENPHQVTNEPLSCLCGRLVAQNTRAAVHTSTSDSMSCDAVCDTQGLKCLAFGQLSRAAESELTASFAKPAAVHRRMGNNGTIPCSKFCERTGEACTGAKYGGSKKSCSDFLPSGTTAGGTSWECSCISQSDYTKKNSKWSLCHNTVKSGVPCLCAVRAERPLSAWSSQSNTGGANQWFLPGGASGVQYKNARTGLCYSLASACRGASTECVTGLHADSKTVACDVGRAPWIDTSTSERRSRAAHPIPHAFGQDPDVVVSHQFWSDITVARTKTAPTTDSHGGEGGGCGAAYPFEGDGRDGHIYASAPVAAGTMDVGASTADTRQRFRCNYKYTSRGSESRRTLAELVGSNRKWKAWWGADVVGRDCQEISRVLHSLSKRSPQRQDRGFGHHMWVEEVSSGPLRHLATCRVYTEVTPAISKKDGLLLNAGNLAMATTDAFALARGFLHQRTALGGPVDPKALSEVGQRLATLGQLVNLPNQELRLHDEKPPSEVALSWNSPDTCLARCADTSVFLDKGTCASAYDAAGRISGDIGCDVQPKPDNFGRAFYGTEGLNYSIVAKSSSQKDLHTRATTTCNYFATGLNREYRQASSYPKRLRGYSSISADHKLVRCRSYREVTEEIKTFKNTTRDMIMNANYLERQVFTESQHFRHTHNFLKEPPNGGYMPHGKKDATKRLVIVHSAGDSVSAVLHDHPRPSGTCAAYCSAIPASCMSFHDLSTHDHDQLGGMALVLKLTEGRRCSESSTAACICQEHADERAPISAVFETGDYALDLTRWPFTFVPERASERQGRPSHLFDTGSDVTTLAAHFGSSCTANEEPFFTTTTAKGGDYSTKDGGGVLRWPVVRVSYHQPSVARVGTSAVAVGNRPMPLMDPVIARTRLFNWRWETGAGWDISANQANRLAAADPKKDAPWESCTRSFLEQPPFPPLRTPKMSKAMELIGNAQGGPCRSNGEAGTGWRGNDVVPGNAYRVFTENDKFYQSTTARCFVAKSSCPGCLRAIASSQDTDFGMSPKSMNTRVPSVSRYGKVHWGPPIAERLQEVVCPENGGAHTCAAFCRTHGGFCLAKRETPSSDSRPADLVTDCHAPLTATTHSVAVITPPTAGAFDFNIGRTYRDKSGGYWRMLSRIAVKDVGKFDLRELSQDQAVVSNLRPSPAIMGLTKIHHEFPEGGYHVAGHAYRSPQKHLSGPMRGYNKYFKAKRDVGGAPPDYDGLADASVGEYVPLADPRQADADGMLHKGFIYRAVSREARTGPGKYFMILSDINIGISRGSGSSTAKLMQAIKRKQGRGAGGPSSSAPRGRAFDIDKQVPVWHGARGHGQKMTMPEWDYPNKGTCEFLKGFTYRSPSTSVSYRVKNKTTILASPACDVARAALTDVTVDTTEDTGGSWCACGHLDPEPIPEGLHGLIHHEFPEGGYLVAGHAYRSPQKHTSGAMRGYHKYFKAKRYVGGSPADYDGLADASVGEYVPLADPAQAAADGILRKGFIYRAVSREARRGEGKYFMILSDINIGYNKGSGGSGAPVVIQSGVRRGVGDLRPAVIQRSVPLSTYTDRSGKIRKNVNIQRSDPPNSSAPGPEITTRGPAYDIDKQADNSLKIHLPEWDYRVSRAEWKSYEDALQPDLRCVCARRAAKPIMTRAEGEYFDGLGDNGLLAWARKQHSGTEAQGGVACSLAATNVPMSEPLPALSEWHWQTARCAQDNPRLSVNWAVGGEFRPQKDKDGKAPPSKCACARYFGYTFEGRQQWRTDCDAEMQTISHRGHGLFASNDVHSMQGVPTCSSNHTKSRIIQPKSYLDKDNDYVNKADNMSPYMHWVRWLNRAEDGDDDGTMQPAGTPAGDEARSYFCCSSHKRPHTAPTGSITHLRLGNNGTMPCNKFCEKTGEMCVGAKYGTEKTCSDFLPSGTVARGKSWECSCISIADSALLADRSDDGLHARDAICRRNFGAVVGVDNVVGAPAAAKVPENTSWISVRVPASDSSERARHANYRCHIRTAGRSTSATFYHSAHPLLTTVRAVAVAAPGHKAEGLAFSMRLAPSSAQRAHAGDTSQRQRLRICRVKTGDKTHITNQDLNYVSELQPTGTSYGDFDRLHVRRRGDLKESVQTAWGLNDWTSRVIDVTFTYGDESECSALTGESGVLCGDDVDKDNNDPRSSSGALGYNGFQDPLGAAYTSRASGLTSQEKMNLGLYQRAGVLRARGGNFAIAKHEQRHSGGFPPLFLPNDFGDVSQVCGRQGLVDGVAKQNAQRQGEISQFHTQYGLSRRVLRGTGQAGQTTGVSQVVYAQLPAHETYAYSTYNPIADLAFAFKSWGFHETTPCRPRHFRDDADKESHWPAASVCGKGKGDDYKTNWLAKYNYSEVVRFFGLRESAHRPSACVMHNGCNAEAVQGYNLKEGNWTYYDGRANRQISSAWHASHLGGGGAPSTTWTGLRGSETKIPPGEQSDMYRVNDGSTRPEWRDVVQRQAGRYYAAPMHDRSAHRFCGLTIGPRMNASAGHIVADGGGRQYDAAACYRFDACHAPVVFGTRHTPHPSGNAPHLSVQKSSLVPSCGRPSYVDTLMPPAGATAKEWQDYAKTVEEQAAPYMQLLVREADVHARAAHVFGGQPSRGELFAARHRIPCATSMSYEARKSGGEWHHGVGGGFRCDTTWHADVGAGVANAPPSVHTYGTAVRADWRGSIDDEVNTCATVGARYQIPRERDGFHGVQTRTTDAEPVLTFMPACAATSRDLQDDEEVVDREVVDRLVQQRTDLLSVSPWALGSDGRQRWPADDLGSGQLGWGGYGTWAWPDERMKTTKPQSVFRGAFYDYDFATGRELAYGTGEERPAGEYPSLKAHLRGNMINARLGGGGFKGRYAKSPLTGMDEPEPRMVIQNGGWLGSALFLRPPTEEDVKSAYWIRARAFGRYFSGSRTLHPQSRSGVIRLDAESEDDVEIRLEQAHSGERTARLQQLISDGGVADPAVKSSAALPFFDTVSRATTWFQDPPPLPATGSPDPDDAWLSSEGIPAGHSGGAGWLYEDGAYKRRLMSFARLCRRTLSRVRYTLLAKGSPACKQVRVMRDGAGTRVVVTADGLRIIKEMGGCGCEVLGGDDDDHRASSVFDTDTTAALGDVCPPIALREKDPLPALCDGSLLNSNWAYAVRDVPLWARDVRKSQPVKSWTACAAGAKEVGGAFVFYDSHCWVRPASSPQAEDTPYPPNTSGAVQLVTGQLTPLAVHGVRVAAAAEFTAYKGPYRSSAAVAGSMGAGDGLPAFYGDPYAEVGRVLEVTAVSRRDLPGDTAFVARIGSSGEHKGLYMLAAPPGFVHIQHSTVSSLSRKDKDHIRPVNNGTMDLVRAAVTCLLSTDCTGLVAVPRKPDGTSRYTIAREGGKSPVAFRRAAATTPGVLDPQRVRVIDGRELAPVVGVRSFEAVLLGGTSNTSHEQRYPRLYSDRPYRYRESLAAYLQHDPAHLAGSPLDLLQTSAIPDMLPPQLLRRSVREAAAWELDRLATTHGSLTADAHLDAVMPETRSIIAGKGGTCKSACAAKNMECATTATLRQGESMSRDGGMRQGSLCDRKVGPGTQCYCRAYRPAEGLELESVLLDSRPCSSWKQCDSGACHLSDNGLLGRCARRTRMHAMRDVAAGYRGNVGVGVPYAFAREAAAMHRIYGATTGRTGAQMSYAVRIFSGPSALYQDITQDSQTWMAGLPAAKDQQNKILHKNRWAVLLPPHVPEVYTERLVSDPTGAAAQLRRLQRRLARTRFCASEGGTCMVASNAASGVVRIGTVMQSLSATENTMRLRSSADAHWEFETTCTCANGQQSLVGMPKTPAWSLAARITPSGVVFHDTITKRHHADISYGTSGSTHGTTRALSLVAADSNVDGIGPWYESGGQVAEAVVQSVTKRSSWAGRDKKARHALAHRMLTTSGGGPPIEVEVPFCAGGQASGVFRRTVQPSERGIYSASNAPTDGVVRLGVAAECTGAPENLPRTVVAPGESIFCEPSAFTGAAERVDGLGPARYCTYEASAAARAMPTVVDALMAIVQGRVKVRDDLTAVHVVVAEAPPHSFAQAYLRQVWRHHAWRHGVGVLGEYARANFESQKSLVVGRFDNDPQVAGDELTVLSMYNRIPTDRLLPAVYTPQGEVADACRKDVGLVLHSGKLRPTDGLSDFWRRKSDPYGGLESCKSVFGITDITNTTTSGIFVRSRADRARQETVRQSGMDTWALLGCGGSQQSQKSGEETNMLHVPGSAKDAIMDVVLDATDIYVSANPNEYQLGNIMYKDARRGLNAARAESESSLADNSTRTTFKVQQHKVAVQGHLLRAADKEDRESFVDALTKSGHRTGKYDAYNETEAVLRVDSALAPSQQQRWPGNIRPPLEHFAPMKHFASTTDDAWSSKVREAGCCAAQYDDGQQAAWSVTTIKPVNNALHPGWATMGTFQMPQNSRANFYCSADHNPAIRGSKCANVLRDLCYTDDSESDCVAFDGLYGGKSTLEADTRPPRCMGFFAQDVAVRTTCRAFSRSITNWSVSSSRMEAYCKYHEVTRADPDQQAKARDAKRTDSDDPRRLQCMHWCAWFCRQDTPPHAVGIGGNRQFMCDPNSRTPDTPASAGGWCERYMMPSAVYADSAVKLAVNATMLGSGGRTRHGGASQVAASLSENPLFATSASKFGACLADTSQNKRHTRVCGCIAPDTWGAVNISSLGNAQCYNIAGCRSYGFMPYASKAWKCNDGCSIAQSMVIEGGVKFDKGASGSISQSATCCTVDEDHTSFACPSKWCPNLSAHRTSAIMECAHRPDPAVPGDHARLTSSKADCTAVVASATHADIAWLRNQTQNEEGARLVLSGYKKAMPADAANTVMCMRHAGVYRCGRGVSLDLHSHSDDDDVSLSTRLLGDADGDESTAGFVGAAKGAVGMSGCAVSCDKDAVLGSQLAKYGATPNARVGRCLGFRYEMASGICIPYGSSAPPGAPPSGTVVVADASIGGGLGECRMRCEEAGKGSCSDAEIPAPTPLGERGNNHPNTPNRSGSEASPAGTSPAGTSPAGTSPAGTSPAGTSPAGDEPPKGLAGAGFDDPYIAVTGGVVAVAVVMAALF